MKVYKSKVDWWLLVLVFVPIIAAASVGISEDDYSVIYIMLPITAGILYLFGSIKYSIDREMLSITAGVFINQKIKIADIKSVTKTNNPLSAPALSLDRLEIKYGSNFDYVLVSPKNREDFVNSLLAINPDIKVTL